MRRLRRLADSENSNCIVKQSVEIFYDDVAIFGASFASRLHLRPPGGANVLRHIFNLESALS